MAVATLSKIATRNRTRPSQGSAFEVAKVPDVGMGESYSVRLGRGNIARIQLGRRRASRYFVHWVYVPPAWRGHGLGETLLRRVLRDADRAGISLSLVAKACGTMDQETLERWYERHGFVAGRLVKLGRTMKRDPRAASRLAARRVA